MRMNVLLPLTVGQVVEERGVQGLQSRDLGRRLGQGERAAARRLQNLRQSSTGERKRLRHSASTATELVWLCQSV